MMQFHFEILWVSSQPIFQWKYIIYFYIRDAFLATFCTSFWKKVHNSKEIVNMQGLFVLTVGYVDMNTFPLISNTILLKKYILFIVCLYCLSVHFHSCCFYIQYHGGIREINSMLV